MTPAVYLPSGFLFFLSRIDPAASVIMFLLARPIKRVIKKYCLRITNKNEVMMSEPLDLSELSPAAREALEFLKQNLSINISIESPRRLPVDGVSSKVTITVALCDEVISENYDWIEFR